MPEEMRKCKECGKLFQPKGREQYCSDIHYRPCPVCGTPVEAKYLSDPARRCEACKKSGKKMMPVNKVPSASSQPAATVTEGSVLGYGLVRKFIGKSNTLGFVSGRTYLVDITRDEYCYVVDAKEDITSGESICKQLRHASTIAVNQNWADEK